jgi:hypothetical protein
LWNLLADRRILVMDILVKLTEPKEATIKEVRGAAIYLSARTIIVA